MITKFETDDSIKYLVLPQITEFNNISLQEGDTLVIFMDLDKYDVETCNSFLKGIAEMFPNNQVLMFPLDSRLEVIKKDDKKLF